MPAEANPPDSRLAPQHSCLLLSFQPQRAPESSCPPQAFPMKLVPALCSQNPCLCSPFPLSDWTDPDLQG